ncbi:hypothetical protein QVD99_001948 [Batrachochytrium dendrobatidis]|nr:hypothetical protein QVD99_001948 [Batrachochytrium dendrobatidis]
MDKDDKYKKLKRRLKEVIEENDRLTTKLKRIKHDNAMLKKEKDILLEAISKNEKANTANGQKQPRLSDSLSDTSLSTLSDDSDHAPLQTIPVHAKPDPLRDGSLKRQRSISKSEHVAIPAQNGALIQTPIQTKITGFGMASDASHTPSFNYECTPGNTSVMSDGQCATPSETHVVQGSDEAKKKRKRNDVTARVRKIQEVAVHEDGTPVLPAQFGMITLHSLGEIVWNRSGFHTERHIFPVGFTTSREYYSMIDSDKSVRYICQIIDNGDCPKFQVTPDDAPNNIIIGASATGAWMTVIKAAITIRNKDHSNTVSGPDMFGYSQPTIQKLIQDLPNANLCKMYKFQKFEVSTSKRGPKTKFDNGKLSAPVSGAPTPVPTKTFRRGSSAAETESSQKMSVDHFDSQANTIHSTQSATPMNPKQTQANLLESEWSELTTPTAGYKSPHLRSIDTGLGMAI